MSGQLSIANLRLAEAARPLGNEAALSAAASRNVDRAASVAFAYLTPESLLAYCAMKLRGIDEQIQAGMVTQQQRNNLSTKLSEVAAMFSGRAQIAADGAGVQEYKDAVELAYHHAIMAAGGKDTPIGQRLSAEKWKFDQTASGQGPNENEDPSVSGEEIRDFTNAIQQIQKDINLEGDLQMINLQSLMSARQQAIQMCTNMVASLGQSSQGIAANIGK